MSEQEAERPSETLEARYLREARELSRRGLEPDQRVQLGNNLWLYGGSQQRAAFFVALAQAQASYAPIERTRTVTVRPREGLPYTFDYAPLEEVIAATRPALTANGLAYASFIADGANGPELHTMLTHADGAFMHAIEALPRAEKPQAMGSALTYHRRYQYQCITGTSPEYDDDGNEASGNQVQGVQQKNRQPPLAAQATAQRQGPPPATKQAPPKQAAPAASAQPAAKPAPTPSSPPPPAHVVADHAPPPAQAAPPEPAPAPASEPDNQGYDPTAAPMTADERTQLVKLALALKMTQGTVAKLLQERLAPDKTMQNLTRADAAVLTTLLEQRLKGGGA